MSTLFSIGLMLLFGLLFGRMVKLIGLPNVTGYIVAGLIIGPHVIGIISTEAVDSIGIVSEIALAFIALSIGAEFKLSYFKELGITPVVIAFFEAIFATAFVITGLIFFGFEMPLAVILGAIASATAPATTIMVIKQYHAKGMVSKTLLSVVALDDVMALILFSFAVAFIKLTSADSKNILISILNPFIELGISALLGIVFSLFMLIPLRFFKKQSNRMCAIVGVVFVVTSLATYIGASSLLTCMIFGAVLVNITKDAVTILKITDMISPPILMLFFVVSGAKLDISVVTSIGAIGAIYIIMRVIGKYFGSRFGAVITKSPATVKKYLGLTLVPQAGVAIGFTFIADEILPEYSGQIRAVVLSATLIYELIGPVISKIALTKAGEIVALPKKDDLKLNV